MYRSSTLYARSWFKASSKIGLIIKVRHFPFPYVYQFLIPNKEYTLYQWLRRNALDYFHDTAPAPEMAAIEEGWEERQQAKKAVKAYLTDTPSTVAFVHGPQGSGKTALIEQLVSESDRTVLVIDCKELLKTSSDSETVGALAKQTGYWPMFTFLNSMSSLIDLASVGLIGQKSK